MDMEVLDPEGYEKGNSFDESVHYRQTTNIQRLY